MNGDDRHSHNYLLNDETISRNERRMFIVVALTSVMMVAEVVAGYLTSSMALLADGWHMASHAGALTIGLMAYKLARSEKIARRLSFGSGKLVPLGGYTSAIALAIIALAMGATSVERLFSPVGIRFNEAIVVAVIGLAVNVVCALLLSGGRGHHGHEGDNHARHVRDHNLHSAHMHVMADALTSVFAIGALVLGKYFNAVWLDPLMGVAGSAVILRWAYGLLKETAWELLDAHAKPFDHEELKSLIEGSGAEVNDLHVWRIAPNAYACELVIASPAPKGADYYRELIAEKFPFAHLVIEERPRAG